MQRNMAPRLPGQLQWMVTSWNGNWPPSLTTVAKVLAGAEVHWLSVIKNHSKFQRHNTGTALLMCTYSALFFFLSAALSGHIRTHKFGEFPVRGSWKSDTTPWGHASKRSWVWMMRHCLISLIAGTTSLIAQVLLYGWLEESLFVKGTLSIVLSFAVLFLGHLIRLLLRD